MEERQDLISRQAAIDECNKRGAEHIGYAIAHLPSAQLDNRLTEIADLVEGTIDHFNLEDAMDLLYQIKDVLDGSDELSSAQPEIIRCKDCRWWDKSEDSPFGYCMAMKHGYMSANWEIGIYRRYKGDFYCADAERRTDD